MSSHDYTSIEDLLLATLDAVSRFRVGQRDAVGAALDAGALLTEAKGRLKHGEWGEWIGRVGLAKRTASMWMRLASLGPDGRGGDCPGRHCPNAPGRRSQIGNGCRFGPGPVTWPKPKRRSADTKRAYYDALSRRNAALRALARGGRDE